VAACLPLLQGYGFRWVPAPTAGRVLYHYYYDYGRSQRVKPCLCVTANEGPRLSYDYLSLTPDSRLGYVPS